MTQNYIPAVLQGVAIGDALGAPHETPPHILPDSTRMPSLDGWTGEMLASADGPPGTGTDDTGMSVALAQSLLEPGGYILERAAEEYLRWYRGMPDKSRIGGTIQLAMAYLNAGNPIGQCGIRDFPTGRVGNGTAMRAAPLGVYCHTYPERAAEWAAADASLTHNHPEATAGSAAVALAVAHAVRLRAAPEEQWHLLPDLVLQGLKKNHRYTRVYSLMLLVREVCERRERWDDCDATSYEELMRDIGAGGDVAHTVATALLATCLPTERVTKGSEAFRESLILAVRVGGDTDTRAALTGAVMGARYGREALPPEWAVQDGDTLDRLDRALYMRSLR